MKSGDLSRVADLVMRTDHGVYFEAESVERELSDELRGVDLAHDSRLVFAPDGTLVGAATLTLYGGGRSDGFAVVHPDSVGKGIGGALIYFIEDRTREYASSAGQEKNLYFMSNAVNERTARLMSRNGYEEVRRFLTMEIPLDGETPPSMWPDGISVRSFSPDEAEAVYRAQLESFEDHWHGEDETETFEEWSRHSLERGDHDPSLWFVAEESGEIAGIVLCVSRSEKMGWVDILGVRKPWRGRGLGEALLRHAFSEFRRRGKERVELGVDSESLTGATRLYERVGMEIVRDSVLYRKRLRPSGGEYV